MRFTDHLNDLAGAAIEEVANGEAIDHEIFVAMIPSQNGQPTLGIIMAVIVPGPEIGRRGFSMSMVPDVNIGDDDFSEEIKNMVRRSFEARSQALASGVDQVSSHSGLIVPGR